MTSHNYSALIITLNVAIISMVAFLISHIYGVFGDYIGVGLGFCETMQPGLTKQPINTYSNLGFIVSGLAMAWSLKKSQNQFYGTVFSCLTVLIGPGSMSLHATGTRLGGQFDINSMYLIASYMMSYATYRLFFLRKFHFILIFIFTFSTCQLDQLFPDITILLRNYGEVAFGFYIILVIIFEVLIIMIRKSDLTLEWAYLSIFSFSFSFLIWNKASTGGPWCVPDSFLQGHAIWHLLCSWALYCLFRYYASERVQNKYMSLQMDLMIQNS
jgi:hypothetical protein